MLMHPSPLPLIKLVLELVFATREDFFFIAKTEWQATILDVDMGEVLRLLSAMKWVIELNLVNMNFETDSKVVADSIYGKDDVSDFMAIINDCRHLL